MDFVKELAGKRLEAWVIIPFTKFGKNVRVYKLFELGFII